MFEDIVLLSANLIKPTIDTTCNVNGICCNIYYKRNIDSFTQITGRGDFNTNDSSYLTQPDFYKKPLLIDTPVKVGYKGSGKNNSKGAESVDSITEEKSYIITYDKQYGIDWKSMMKIEVFYNRAKTQPDVVYQTSEVKEMPLPNNKTIHSGLIHVYLVPMM